MSATFVTDIADGDRAVGRCSSRRTSGSCRSSCVSVALIVGLPKISPWFFGRYGDRVIEPEIKLVFASLFVLMYLGEPGELPGGAAGVRARPRDERPLRPAPPGTGTPARGRVRVPDAVLLPQGRAERLARRASGRTSASSRSCSSAKMVPKLGGVYPLARRYCSPARGVHDAADVDRAHVRHDHVALRAQARDHRPHPVLAPARRSSCSRRSCRRRSPSGPFSRRRPDRRSPPRSRDRTASPGQARCRTRAARPAGATRRRRSGR